MAHMSDSELARLIKQKAEQGIGGDNSDISYTRQTIFDRYMGELYGNEQEGQSKITTREVFETVEWAMPSIVRVFESGDRVIEFDASGPDDEKAAEQETDAVNHVYQKDSNGFVTTHNIIKSALMNPNSYAMVYRDEREVVTTENYENLNEQELAQLLGDQDNEIVGQEINSYGLYDVEVKNTTTKGKIKIDVLPEEDVVVDSGHSDLNLDECAFVCHKPKKTKSWLIENGYDVNDLDLVNDDGEYRSEEQNRKFYADENDYDDEIDPSMKEYTVYNAWLRVDYDGDGLAEFRNIVVIGNKVFENEEIDMMCIVSAASILMPHKHTGYGLAQSIIDLQNLKTYFMRQTVNNMGRVNNPRTLVTKGANMSDVLSRKANGVIRIKQPGDVTTEPTTPIIGQVIPLLDLIDQQKEGRSGITRNSMGLDADILAKSTEGAFMGAIEKAEQRVEFIVRLFAETVFKDIFLKIHQLLLKHGDTKWMKLNGQWEQVNPQEWRSRESMTVNVGLGMGNRQQKRITAQMITQDHDRLIAAGAMGTLISPQNIFNGRRLMVEAAGEKSVDKYYINPEMQPPKQPAPPQPDPNMVMIQSNERIEQGKVMLKQAEIQQKGQIEFARFQFEQAKAARELQFEQTELQFKNEIEGLKAQISQGKNDNDAGAKALQAKIDQLEMQLEDSQAAEKLAMDKYKADLDSETKITLKQMDQQSLAEPVIEQNQAQIDGVLNSMAQIINDMNQPKEIIKDENGSPIGIRNMTTGDVRSIIKDENGLPAGIE